MSSWILSRRRYCIHKTNNVICVVEELQNGHCDEVDSPENLKSKEMNDPMCAHETSFEKCDIKIVP